MARKRQKYVQENAEIVEIFPSSLADEYGEISAGPRSKSNALHTTQTVLDGSSHRHNRSNTPRNVLTPINKTQELLIGEINRNSCVVCIGPAGTGKTFIPTKMAALCLCSLSRSVQRKAVVVRPVVGTEKLGHLPGTLEEKYSPWAYPILEIFKETLTDGDYRHKLKSGAIEMVPLNYMRGRTFRDAFVILDEAQNTTYSQIKMFLTRLGTNCKTVITGDLSQTDIKEKNGLAYILEIINEQNLPFPVVRFSKDEIVRSGECAIWAEAFDKYEESS